METRKRRAALGPGRLALVGALVLAGCTAEAAVSPASPVSPATSALVTARPAATTPPSEVPSPSRPAAATLPADPPAAVLAGLAGGKRVAGSLGSYTWGGSGSDGPWVVGARLGAVHGGASVSVAFGAVAPVSWTAAWARVADRAAGVPTGDASGSGAVAVSAPTAAGDWSLRVTATFGPGANATYFWHVEVTR